MSDEQMGTSDTQQEPAGSTAAPTQPAEDKATRRLLQFFVGILAIAVISLLILLFWLLRPKEEAPTESAEGYPIVPITSLLAWGGTLEDPLQGPLGTAFDAEGNAWVADTANGRVIKFSETGESLLKLGDITGPGKLAGPYGVVVDDAGGRIYVADWPAGRVMVYTDTGEFITSFPNEKQDLKEFGPDGFFPYDVELINGRLVATSNNGIYFFDLEGSVVARWGQKQRGSGYSQFNFPNSLAVDADRDRLYVTDSLNKRVVALNSDAEVQWISGSVDLNGQTTGFWQLPRGITVGPDDNIYVVDTFRTTETGVGDGYIVVLDPEGNLVSAFGKYADSEDAFSFPNHIDYNDDGLWAVADREHNRVLLFELLPLPEPDQKNTQEYPGSFDPGPFPEPVGPAMGPWAAPETPAETTFPWWIVILVLILVTFIGIRIWRNRKRRQREQAWAAAQAEGANPDAEASPVGAPEAEATPPNTPPEQD